MPLNDMFRLPGGSLDNGGSAVRKVRNRSQIVGVCRPEYKEASMEPDPDYSTHWARDEIERATERGLLKGCPDRTFKLDQPITRAEAAVIALRLYDKILEVAT